MQAQVTYDWDDIVVGDSSPGDSFFAQRHIKHEKFLLVPEMASVKIDENLLISNNENQIIKSPQIRAPRDEPEQPKQNKVLESIENTSQIIDKVESKSISKNNTSTAKRIADEGTSLMKTKNPNNLKAQWTPKNYGQIDLNIKSKNVPQPPQAYRYKDTYEKHKQELIRKINEREKIMRVFHSNPVPNFALCHQQLERKKPPHKVTPAVTPMVLKISKEKEEKRRQKLEEWKMNNQVPKFASREALVLQEEPFKPKKCVTIVKTMPFNLNSEKRLEERKQFDERTRRNLEEKKKQEEEERKKREEKEAKELRKLASNFKATPNPFK